jgi:inhibitor of KinA sporulation pathway (predicted exonuclease)
MTSEDKEGVPMGRPAPIEVVNLVDVESTCWQGDPPPGERSEIIQIGITTVALHFPQIVRSFGWYVKPTHSKVSEFCTQLTGITQEDLDQYGVSFGGVCAALRENFDTRENVWVSWGDYDRKMFETQCQNEGVPYPFGRRHLNLKTLCAILYRTRHEKGMDQMLEYLGIPLEGTHHHAVDDSKNIARIFLHVVDVFNIGVQAGC